MTSYFSILTFYFGQIAVDLKETENLMQATSKRSFPSTAQKCAEVDWRLYNHRLGVYANYKLRNV